MRDLSQSIGRLTQELRELRLQLQWTNSQPARTGEHSQVLNHVLGATLVPDLTDVVEQITQFLWRYIDSAARPAAEADFALQSQRLEQATEMLRRLRCSSPKPAEDPAAFVSRVTKIVDRLMESRGEPELGGDEQALPLERSA